RASMNPCSVVPGLPKMRRTPSAMSCSIIARLPVILGIVGLQELFGEFYRSAPGPSLKSEGTNVCGSAGSVSSACWRGGSRTSGGGGARAGDKAVWKPQYLEGSAGRWWSAPQGAVRCIPASENNTPDPAGISGVTTHEAFSGASWIWRGSLKLLL